MGFRVGIDVGGTFTDAVMLNEDTGAVTRTKVLTVADDQSRGTLEAMTRVAEDPARVDSFCHGYTVGINAALTRRGAKTGMLVTAGHRDIVDTGRVYRPFDRLYDATWIRPHEKRPIVERRHRRDVPERLNSDGETLLPLDEAAVRAQIEFLRAEGVEAVGVCFLHAYQNDANEARVRELVEELMPEAYVQTSEIWPMAREFDRTFVVMLDAYTGPPVVRYLDRLEARLREAGFEHPIDIMQMSGGTRTLDSVKRAPVYTLQSGPVAGLRGAEFYSEKMLDGRDLVCLDIGGTSSDIGVILGGHAEVTNEWELEHGIPLAITSLDVRSIGAGGGSLVSVDAVGSIDVGPMSAGSDPGPACYGLGGTQPAMTDSYAMMGLLQPELFLGGRMDLDRLAAEAALGAVGARIGMSAEQLAEAAYQITNVKLAGAIRELTLARGLDPREFSLFAYGAAGAMHAVAVARELGVTEVVVPYFPGGFSAFGMIVSQPRVEASRAVLEPAQAISGERLSAILKELSEQCVDDLTSQGVETGEVELSYYYNAMYQGQGSDNRLPLPGADLDPSALAQVAADFHAFHDRRYGYQTPEIPIVVTSVSVVGLGPEPIVNLTEESEERTGGLDSAVVTRDSVRLDGEVHADVPFYDRPKLQLGDEIEGPAVIDDRLGTIVVTGNSVARVAEYGTLRIEVKA